MILALDSSTNVLSIALVAFEGKRPRLVCERRIDDGGKHGAQLPGSIEALLSEAGLGLAALSGCAAGIGPGSFTGLRVGLATLKGLCFARRLPIAGAPSLRAVALAAAGELGAAGEGALLCPLFDARRGEVYAAVYRGAAAEPVLAEASMPPGALAAFLAGAGGRVRIFGDGLWAHGAALEPLRGEAELWPEGPRTPRAFDVAALCGPAEGFRPEALFSIEPRYVRPSEAELKFPGGTFVPHPSLDVGKTGS